jgi:hypothetical protein
MSNTKFDVVIHRSTYCGIINKKIDAPLRDLRRLSIGAIIVLIDIMIRLIIVGINYSRLFERCGTVCTVSVIFFSGKN